MASSSSAPSSRARRPLPAPGSLYFDYLEATPVGFVIDMDLKGVAEEGNQERKPCQFSTKKVGDGEWSLIDGGTESVSIGGVATTAALFTFVRLNMQGESSISVAHGTDPRRIKKEVVDQGLEPELPRFFSIAETIELNSDDDEEKLSVTEMVKREGKSLYEAVRPLHMHMQMDLLHLLGFGPVFLCNNRSHLASMIAQKYRTKIEKVAPGSALTAVHVHRHMHIHVHVHMHHVHACPLVVLAGPTFAHCPEHLLVPSTFGITVGLTLAFQLALALVLAGQGRDDLDPNPNPDPDLDLNPNSDLNHR